MKKKGFTLIELMIVVAIIGILAAIAIPNFLKFQAKARQSEAKTNLAGIATAEIAYYAEKQFWGHTFEIIGYAPTGKTKYALFLADPGTVATDSAIADTDGSCAGGPTECVDQACTDVPTLVDVDVMNTAATSGFTAHAVGNIDSDTLYDCWYIDQNKHPENPNNDVSN